MQKKREDGHFNHEEDDMWEKSMRTHAFEVIRPHVKTLNVDRALHTLSPHSVWHMLEPCVHTLLVVRTQGCKAWGHMVECMWYTVSKILLMVLNVWTHALSIRTYALVCPSSSRNQCVLMVLKVCPYGYFHEHTCLMSMWTHSWCILTQGFQTLLIVLRWGHRS